MHSVGMPMYRLRTIFSGTPVSDGLSTVHYDAAASTPGAAVSHLGAMLDGLQNYIQASQNWTVSGTVDLIDEVTGDLIDSTAGTDYPVLTIATDAPLPPANQLMLRLGTATVVDGRRLKGRIFLPGLTEAASSGAGVVDPAVVGAVSGELATWVSGVGAQPVVWHRPKAATETEPASPGSKAPITTATVWTQWAVLRQRRPSS